MSDRFSAELLREMENSIQNNEKDEEEGEAATASGIVIVKYKIVTGLRDGSELMWAYEENHLYYKNTSHLSKKRGAIG